MAGLCCLGGVEYTEVGSTKLQLGNSGFSQAGSGSRGIRSPVHVCCLNKLETEAYTFSHYVFTRLVSLYMSYMLLDFFYERCIIENILKIRCHTKFVKAKLNLKLSQCVFCLSVDLVFAYL